MRLTKYSLDKELATRLLDLMLGMNIIPTISVMLSLVLWMDAPRLLSAGFLCRKSQA